MNNNLANPLEELEKIPGGVASQLVKLPGDIVAGGVKTLLGKQANQNLSANRRIDPLTGIEIPSHSQMQKLKRKERKQKASGLAMMRQTINAAKPQSNNATKSDVSQLPAYIAGKPGFSEEKTIKKPLPPPIAAVKRKFSTGERKHGVGG